MTILHAKIQEMTDVIRERSKNSRAKYVAFINEQTQKQLAVKHHCTNLAHGCASLPEPQKQDYIGQHHHNIGIITAYNDMLSAHHPFKDFPDKIYQQATLLGMTSQVAGGVPAMCDGITQGTDSMELSLFSRDLIAQSAAIGLSHNLFHGAVYLGVCDKIIPALFIAAMRFGHLPSLFMPAGPMPSGLSHQDKNKIRQDYAAGTIQEQDLLHAEMKVYHAAGTCTFYGTANSNQLLMEVAGLHQPGSTFISPYTDARDRAIASDVILLQEMIIQKRRIADIVNEKTIINMMIALLATGGSTNLTIHMITMARAAGMIITWEDFSELSRIIPLILTLYPNGSADVNDLHAIGGVPAVIAKLLKAGLLHPDSQTITGRSLSEENTLYFKNHPEINYPNILRDADQAFFSTGGIILCTGNIGKGLMKVSALKAAYHQLKASAYVFTSQEDFKKSFQKGDLNQDCVVVLVNQGAKACGMPELHQMMPALEVLQNRGYRVALLTDGRLSGASGKVPALIHIVPEAFNGGLLGKISTGDIIFLDWQQGIIEVHSKFIATYEKQTEHAGMGRELFNIMRKNISAADQGGSIFEFE